MLAQQLASALAVGVSTFGFRVFGAGRVLGVFAEDDHDELWRRQVRINEAASFSMKNLRHMHLQGRAGMENTLVSYSSRGQYKYHRLLQTISDRCDQYKPDIVIFDNISQLFGGDENDRWQVSHFCNTITSFATKHDCSALLLGHPGKGEGSEYHGSSGWNASARSRLLLTYDKKGNLFLKLAKANYSAKDQIQLVWTNGVLLPVAGGDLGTGPEAEAAKRQREGYMEGKFLEALDELTARGMAVSSSRGRQLCRSYDAKALGRHHRRA